jgi:hypothetical protein
MDELTMEQVVNGLQEISQFPIENRKLEFSKYFSAACRFSNTTPAEISHLTRINIEFVKGLAEGDFSSLPSEVFVRGFLKSIAKIIAIPPEILVNAYSRTLRNEPNTTQKREVLEQSAKRAVVPGKHVKSDPQEKEMVDSINLSSSSKPNWSFDEFDGGGRGSARAQNLQMKDQASEDLFSTTLNDSKTISPPTTFAQQKTSSIELNSEHEILGRQSDRHLGDKQSKLSSFDKFPPSKSNSRQTLSKSNKPLDLSKKALPTKSLESGHRSHRFTLSVVPFKVWAILGGLAVIGAAVLWPNERSPNGTVIEEAKVPSTDLNNGIAAVPGSSPIPADKLVDMESEVATTAGPSNAQESLKTAVPTILDPLLEKGNLVVPEGKQVVEINASEEVKVRVFIDGKASELSNLNAAHHTFSFENFAEFFIYDASAVEVTFNGRDLGQLGGKGKIRRLSFAKRLKENKNIN